MSDLPGCDHRVVEELEYSSSQLSSTDPEVDSTPIFHAANASCASQSRLCLANLMGRMAPDCGVEAP